MPQIALPVLYKNWDQAVPCLLLILDIDGTLATQETFAERQTFPRRSPDVAHPHLASRLSDHLQTSGPSEVSLQPRADKSLSEVLALEVGRRAVDPEVDQYTQQNSKNRDDPYLEE